MTIHNRHLDVHQNQIVAICGNQVHCDLTISGGIYLVRFIVQVGLNQLPVFPAIINQQQAHVLTIRALGRKFFLVASWMHWSVWTLQIQSTTYCLKQPGTAHRFDQGTRNCQLLTASNVLRLIFRSQHH